MRLFVAVRPPPEVLDLLATLPRPQHAPARWTTREQWHVTLRFFGNVDDPTPVITALEPAVAPLAPVEATIGPRAGILGHQVVYLPVVGLDDVAAVVEGATKTFGQAPPARRFRGHLTLARTKGGVVDRSALDLSVSWTVQDLELIRSHLGGGPARYETLVTFGLSGNA